MIVVVNGQDRDVRPGDTIADVIAQLDVGPGATGVAVACNGEVVLRRRWSDVTVAAGDRIEVLQAVQGG